MEEIVSLLNGYLAPEIVFLIPFLMYIGTLLKKSKRIADTLIPSILISIAIPLALIFSIANTIPLNIAQWIAWCVTGIGQGVFAGSASVGIHQLLKQNVEYKNLKNWDKKEELREEIKKELLKEDKSK